MNDNPINWESYLDIASISDVGMRRSNNQDSYAVSLATSLDQWKQRGHLFMVADGMGAHAAGELASRLAVDHVPHLYRKFVELSGPEALRRAVIEANAEINRRGQANEEFYNMGTTCTALTLLPQGAVVAHIGDSRVYRLRKGRLEQMTFDHSLVWEMRASGHLNVDNESALAIPKNVITRSLGPYPEVKVDLEGPFPVEVGDVFLVCSDGLTGQVSDNELGPILAHLPPKQAAQVLVDISNLRGGPDNITLIIAQVKRLSPQAQQARPITINAKPIRRSVWPLAWGTLIGSALLSGLLWWITGSSLTAAIPGLVMVASLLWLLILWIGSARRGTVVTAEKRFGKAPYSRLDCQASDHVIEQLEQITNQLCEAALEEQWAVDRKRLDSFFQQARDAARENRQSDAIRAYALGISFLMEQLRNRRKSADSTVDL
jgi:protein phosphatase